MIIHLSLLRSPPAKGLHASAVQKALPEGPTEIEKETKVQG